MLQIYFLTNYTFFVISAPVAVVLTSQNALLYEQIECHPQTTRLSRVVFASSIFKPSDIKMDPLSQTVTQMKRTLIRNTYKAQPHNIDQLANLHKLGIC